MKSSIPVCLVLSLFFLGSALAIVTPPFDCTNPQGAAYYSFECSLLTPPGYISVSNLGLMEKAGHGTDDTFENIYPNIVYVQRNSQSATAIVYDQCYRRFDNSIVCATFTNTPLPPQQLVPPRNPGPPTYAPAQYRTELVAPGIVEYIQALGATFFTQEISYCQSISNLVDPNTGFNLYRESLHWNPDPFHLYYSTDLFDGGHPNLREWSWINRTTVPNSDPLVHPDFVVAMDLFQAGELTLSLDPLGLVLDPPIEYNVYRYVPPARRSDVPMSDHEARLSEGIRLVYKSVFDKLCTADCQ